MLTLVFFYLVLPFIFAGFAIKFLKRHPARCPSPKLLETLSADPIEKKHFRAVRVEGPLEQENAAFSSLGDFEGQIEAVDAIYQARSSDRRAGASRTYLVLNHKGEILQQI
ncbi:MAG: hypothetical protein HY078_05530 [Elusimicrobia bacterium]|nr:hypothetical protein [Elusimicrobiota bacterium]